MRLALERKLLSIAQEGGLPSHLGESSFVQVVFLDSSKAFYRVRHK